MESGELHTEVVPSKQGDRSLPLAFTGRNWQQWHSSWTAVVLEKGAPLCSGSQQAWHIDSDGLRAEVSSHDGDENWVIFQDPILVLHAGTALLPCSLLWAAPRE